MTLVHPEQHSDGAAERTAVEEIERAIMQISWLAQRQFMQLLDEERFKLTLPQFYTLLHLQQLAVAANMSELAKATHQSAASLTGVVERLVEKSLVERSTHERDRRQINIQITVRGHELISEIKQARREKMLDALALMSEQDAEVLMQLLDRLLSGMARVLERSENSRWA